MRSRYRALSTRIHHHLLMPSSVIFTQPIDIAVARTCNRECTGRAVIAAHAARVLVASWMPPAA